MNIRLSASEVAARTANVKRCLTPIADGPNNLFVVPKSSGENLILAVHGRGFKNVGDFNTFRFKTVAPRFFGMYYEWWKRGFAGKTEYYYLHRAYLHLYEIKSTSDESEFLLLHCDPNEPMEAAHAKYKQCLHLHIESKNAAPPHNIWPHVHIALNAAYLSTTLQDIQAFSHGIQVAVEMLKDEVFSHL